MSEKDVRTQEFINVLAGWLILKKLARKEREYKRLKAYCIKLAELRPTCL